LFKIKEEEKEDAKNTSREIVLSVDEVFIRNIQTLIQILKVNTQFYDKSAIGSYDASKARVMYLYDYSTLISTPCLSGVNCGEVAYS
jgi:hypothetical protein